MTTVAENPFTVVERDNDEDQERDVAPPPVEFAPDPAYPDATEEAPFGYTKSGRIRKRPIGSATRGSKSAAPANAHAAARMLAQINGLVGMSLTMFGMTMTAEALSEANGSFEDMARDALANDPALCRKIMSAGASSGKAQLGMAYLVMGASITPAVLMEIKAKREEANSDEG